VDAYRILQVDPAALDVVLHAAYRALARLHHPDLTRDPNASERMATVNGAYELVRTPERRAGYDVRRRPPPDTRDIPSPVSRSRFRRSGPSGGARLDFGRYRGWSLADLAEHDLGYVRWLVRHSGGARYRREIERILAAAGAGRN
jgi:curved DNA-binding protein CbpA